VKHVHCAAAAATTIVTMIALLLDCNYWYNSTTAKTTTTMMATSATAAASATTTTVQNAAARVVTGTRKFGHITPVLHQLHWLPVHQRITFKLAMITFKCRRGLAPSYLADVCIPVSSVVGRWQLRSANSGTLAVPCTRTMIGRRDFAVSGPATWNCGLHQSSLSFQTLAKKLKTHLFGC